MLKVPKPSIGQPSFGTDFNKRRNAKAARCFAFMAALGEAQAEVTKVGQRAGIEHEENGQDPWPQTATATLASIVSSFVKTVEVAEIETRLVALEKASADATGAPRFDA
jgi:hypothetical protein